VRALRGDAGARDLLIDAGTRELECGHLCRPDDIDTRDDLEVARRHLVEAR
jgi:CTP:molybdopterin cytidylyltransferase MocA